MLKQWKTFWKAFIPQKISNSFVLWVMFVLSYAGRVSQKKQEQNECRNRKKLAEQLAVLLDGKYIENQQDWHQVWFGKGKNHNMSHSGCGIVAAYNAMAALEKTAHGEIENYKKIEHIISLIRFFETKGAVLGGRIGIEPKSIASFFEKNGYEVEFTKCSAKTTKEQINVIGNKNEVTIVTLYNNQMNIFEKIHNICITKEQSNFYAHNVGQSARKKEGTTLSEVILSSASDPKVICIIGICKRENNHINS